MGVIETDPVIGGGLSGAVAVVGEDVAYMLVLAGADLQGQSAGSFQSGFAITLGQRQQSQAGAIAVLRMLAFFPQTRHRHGGGYTDVLSPVNQPLWCPFQVRAVRRRHMLGDSGKAAASGVAGMAGDTLPAM